jgi:hypothetical protein
MDGRRSAARCRIARHATGHEYLALAQWGARPRHKDIFVEVDYRRLDLGENANGVVQKIAASSRATSGRISPITVIARGGAAGEPSLAVPSQKRTLALAYRGADGTVRTRSRYAAAVDPAAQFTGACT